MTSATWSQINLRWVIKRQDDWGGGLNFFPMPGKGMVELRPEGGEGASQSDSVFKNNKDGGGEGEGGGD